tara:strand:+ start:1073 stop:1468 length:396 start_codon:yes stop_codon:yes gene_type:complete
MKNQETTMENKEKISKVSYKKSRIEMSMEFEGMNEVQRDEYTSKRAEEFYDKYDWTAKPSETAKILVQPSVNCMQAEFDTWLAQKEQYMKYMGCHTALTFGQSKPSEILKEFGQWLIDGAEHSDWDYEEWN